MEVLSIFVAASEEEIKKMDCILVLYCQLTNPSF
jgi:hypothetical protein